MCCLDAHRQSTGGRRVRGYMVPEERISILHSPSFPSNIFNTNGLPKYRYLSGLFQLENIFFFFCTEGERFHGYMVPGERISILHPSLQMLRVPTGYRNICISLSYFSWKIYLFFFCTEGERFHGYMVPKERISILHPSLHIL